LRPSPRGTPHRVRPQKSVFTAPIEGQPRSFPCAKRQLSVISMLRRESLQPASTIHTGAPVICSKRNCLRRRLLLRVINKRPTGYAQPCPQRRRVQSSRLPEKKCVRCGTPSAPGGDKLCATELTLSGISWLRRCSDIFGRPAPRSRRVARLRSSVYRRLPDEK
jgi:hypothetical protein